MLLFQRVSKLIFAVARSTFFGQMITVTHEQPWKVLGIKENITHSSLLTKYTSTTNWFLYDRDLRHERVKELVNVFAQFDRSSIVKDITVMLNLGELQVDDIPVIFFADQ